MTLSISTNQLRPAIRQRVDFNNDAIFDVKDIELFERRHKLPPLLSNKMKSLTRAKKRR